MSQSKMMRRRLKLAHAVERAAVVERPVVCGGPAYLVHPTVTVACAESLHEIARLLRDAEQPIATSILYSLAGFITDGQSSFFGRDVEAAHREAAFLQHITETGQSAVPAVPSRLRRRPAPAFAASLPT